MSDDLLSYEQAVEMLKTHGPSVQDNRTKFFPTEDGFVHKIMITRGHDVLFLTETTNYSAFWETELKISGVLKDGVVEDIIEM
jgi:hypothetical protein